jgi:hypothetical protein
MIRKLKALGLALCAVFMFGAFSASGALAVNDVFTSEVNDTFVTGTQVVGTHANVFSTKWEPNATLSCTGGTYTGTFTGASATEVELTPKYTGCSSAGLSVTVDDEGCKYVFTGHTHLYTNTAGQAEGEKATAKLNCNHTGKITITFPLGCDITIKDTSGPDTVNQALKGVTYDNIADGAKWDIRVTVTIDGIHYTSSGCGFLGITATDNDGFLTKNITLRGYTDAGHTTQVNVTQS